MNNPTDPDDLHSQAPAQPEPAPSTVELPTQDEPGAADNDPAPYASTQRAEDPYAASSYPAAAPAPKRRTKLFYVVAGVIATVLVLGLLCGGALGFGVFHAWQTSGAVSPVLEQTMQAMQAKDVDQALTLFARPIQGDELRANLEQMIDNPDYYAYFEGYKSLSMTGVNAGVNAGNASDKPPGEYADVTADVTYQDGTHRTLTALLNKIEGEWKMLTIQISNPTAPDAAPGATPEATPAEGA